MSDNLNFKFVEYFNELAFKGTEDAQLKAAKKFADIANDSLLIFFFVMKLQD